MWAARCPEAAMPAAGRTPTGRHRWVSFVSPPLGVLRVLNRRKRPVEGDFRSSLVENDVEVVLPFRALFPLSADKRRGAHIGHRVERAALPGDPTDNGVIVRLGYGVANRVGIELLGALEHVDGNPEIGQFEAERLRPLLATRLLVRLAKLARRLAGQARLERMMARPPYFRGNSRASVAQRIDRSREQDRFRRCHDLGPKTLLRALRPKDPELRRVEDTAANVAIEVLQLRDLCREVVGKRRIKAEVVHFEAVFPDGGGKPMLGIARGDTIR